MPTDLAPAGAPILAAAGYLLMGGVFVFAAFDHIRQFAAVRGLLAGRGWPFPGPVLAAASLFQLVAGLGLAFGLLRPWAALGLAGFTVMASLTLLDFWRATGPERAAKRGQFLVNAGLLGGLLLAAAASF